MRDEIRIGGLQKFSLIDYPGLISAVIFTQGCNFRCPYCHNPELVLPERINDPVDPEAVLKFLQSRQGKIDGVTVTGGEPTLQPDLISFMRRIRQLGFKIKLDTNGSRPDVLGKILDAGLADCIAMDIKAPLKDYPVVTGVRIEPDVIRHSIALIRQSGIAHQFRTTVAPGLHTEQMVRDLVRWVKAHKLNHIFQEFKSADILDPSKIRQPDPARRIPAIPFIEPV